MSAARVNRVVLQSPSRRRRRGDSRRRLPAPSYQLRLLAALTLSLGVAATLQAGHGAGGGSGKLVPHLLSPYPSPATSATDAESLNTRPGVKYVGDEACLPCHQDKFDSFKRTGMGRSMSIPSARDTLGQVTRPVELHESGKSFEVYWQKGKLFHREYELDPAGKAIFSDTRQVDYAVGSGDHGRTYLVEQGDFLFVSPVSFYSAPRQWDLSPGNEEGSYLDFDRPAPGKCLFCHSGGPKPVAGTRNEYARPPFAILAIGCERCHGPGELHVQQRRRGEPLPGGVERSIVNPAKLSSGRRDDVCAQCHLAGDAHVLRPGKDYGDFRPGTVLDDVVAIFSVPPSIKGKGFVPIGHVQQMKSSRCWLESKGRMGCITCHDPHVEPRGAAAVAYFKSKCLGCHSAKSCREAGQVRMSTAPPDNCLECHMPKRSVSTVSHAALTDHRILRKPDEVPEAAAGSSPSPGTGLIHDSLPPGATSDTADLRTLALAYAQVAWQFPPYRAEGLRLLERAAREYPDDVDVQSTFGAVLVQAHPGGQALEPAAQALERAVALNSKSAAVRTELAGIEVREGEMNQAVRLLEEAIRLEPYYAPAYLSLASAHFLLNDREAGIKTLEDLLKFQPGNTIARSQLERARGSP